MSIESAFYYHPLIDFPAPLFKSHLPRLSLPDQSITMVSQPIKNALIASPSTDFRRENSNKH